MDLPMPSPPEGDGANVIKHSGRVVFVGANGTGKSRLGAWLEKTIRAQNAQRPQITHLNAQRALTFPAEVPRQTSKVCKTGWLTSSVVAALTPVLPGVPAAP